LVFACVLVFFRTTQCARSQGLFCICLKVQVRVGVKGRSSKGWLKNVRKACRVMGKKDPGKFSVVKKIEKNENPASKKGGKKG